MRGITFWFLSKFSERCGDPLRFPFTCSCDENCFFFNDCCSDYAISCRPTGIQAFHKSNQNLFTCIGIYHHSSIPFSVQSYKIHMFLEDPSKYMIGATNQPTYLVSKCPAQYNTTSSEAVLCDLHYGPPAINTSNQILFKVNGLIINIVIFQWSYNAITRLELELMVWIL